MSQFVRLPEGFFGGGEISDAKPDLPDLIERGRRIAQVELHQLAAGAPGLLLRIAPGPPQAHNLSPVDAAHARKASDRLPLTPAFGRLRPVRGAPVVGHVAAGRDRVAVNRSEE